MVGLGLSIVSWIFGAPGKAGAGTSSPSLLLPDGSQFLLPDGSFLLLP